jgi:hypothetical protein
LNGKQPGTPFCESAIYPSFVVFASYYGEIDERERLHKLQRLAKEQATIQTQLTLTDRAFLLFVYATFCTNFPTPKLWYFTERASATIKKIRTWMQKEDENAAGVEESNKAVAAHIGKISHELEMVIAQDSDDGGDQDNVGSDSDLD